MLRRVCALALSSAVIIQESCGAFIMLPHRTNEIQSNVCPFPLVVTKRHKGHQVWSSTLQVKDSDHDSGNDESYNSTDLLDDNDTSEDELTGPRKIIRDTTFAISVLFSYSMTFIGAALSLGLVLNICGYAYIWGDNGLEIDTIQQTRIKQQFRSAQIKIMKNDADPDETSLLP